MSETYAGFDIGGTKTLGVLVDRDGVVLASHRRPRPRGPEATIDQLVELIALLNAEQDEPLKAVGIGIAGAISRRGSVQFSPNIPELFDFPLQAKLGERIDVPLVVDNDATAATWAEHQLGAGRGVADLLYVALGTGIGVGYVLAGSVYRGANGFAGEAGHMVVNRHGATHISGRAGPWEMYASGTALGQMARTAAEDGRLSGVQALAGSVAAIRGEHVSSAIAQGDAEALALLREFADEVALGLNNLIYILDPAEVVLGGGLVEIGEPLRAAVQRAVDETTLGGEYREPVPIRLAELGSSSAALGAALLAAELS